MDLSLGVTGPLAGLVMSWAGVPVIYLAAAGLVAIALLLTWRLKKRPPEHVPEAASSSYNLLNNQRINDVFCGGLRFLLIVSGQRNLHGQQLITHVTQNNGRVRRLAFRGDNTV